MTFSELLKSDKPVLLDFYADWCAPCRAMKPILDDVKKQLGDEIVIYKIDVDRNQAVAEQLQIRSIPTLMVFKNGAAVWRKSGIASVTEIRKAVG